MVRNKSEWGVGFNTGCVGVHAVVPPALPTLTYLAFDPKVVAEARQNLFVQKRLHRDTDGVAFVEVGRLSGEYNGVRVCRRAGKHGKTWENT